VYRRVEALLLVAKGQTVTEAARRCHVDRSSVHRWLGQYSARRDAAALADRLRIAMLRRPERATVWRRSKATDWQGHTVRGFFAGLKKRCVEASVLERVRQVGPGREGAQGSYTAYCINEAD
jgi:hypothetical protein